MKNNISLKEVRKEFSNAQFASFVILFVLAIILGVGIPVVVPNSTLQNVKLSKDYVAGELADEDVYAPASVSFVDEVATKEKREESARSVLPYFTYNVSSTLGCLTDCNTYMDAILKKGSLDPGKALEEAGIVDSQQVTERLESLGVEKKNLITRIVIENLESILKQGLFSESDVVITRQDGYDEVTAELPRKESYELVGSTVKLSDVLTEVGLYEYLVQIGLKGYPTLGFDNIMLAAEATMMFATPNVRYNEMKTLQLRDQEAARAGSVVIRVEKGDLIIGKDTVITEQQLRTIERINEIRVDTPISALIGQAVFLIAVLTLGVGVMFYFIPYKFRIPLYTLMFLGFFDMSIIVSYFVMIAASNLSLTVSLDSMLPYLFLPVFFTCVTNKRRIGLTIGFIYAGFSVVFPTSGKYSFFYLLSMIEAAVLFVRFGTNRIDTIYQAFYSSICAAAITAIYCLVSDFTYTVLVNSIIVSVLNIVISFIVVNVLLPIVEMLFNIPTTFRLHELSYADSPTLNRLNQVAQGTFNHVRNVSDMAYLASKEIGANAELAREEHPRPDKHEPFRCRDQEPREARSREGKGDRTAAGSAQHHQRAPWQ